MKLAFCLFKYFPYGGLQRDFIRIVEACQQRGHDIDIYTQRWEGEKPSNITVTIVPHFGLTLHKCALSFSKNLNKILRKKHYDGVIGFNKIPGLDIYYAADICYQQDILERYSSWYRLTPRYKVYQQLEKSVFDHKAHTHILLLSKYQQKIFITHYQTSEERLHIVPPSVDAHHHFSSRVSLLRKHVRKTLHIKRNQLMLLMVGSGFKTKGVDRAIKALASLPEELRRRTLLTVIGKGRPKTYLKLAEQLDIKDQVKFLGVQEDVYPYYVAADLLIHPAYREAAGKVLLEALACYLPILTTQICGFASYVEAAEAGIVLPLPYQQNIFNEALSYVLISKELLFQFKKSAKQYVKQHPFKDNSEWIVRKIEEILHHR